MSITSVNAVITLSVPLILPVPFVLEGFAADDIFDSDELDMAETIMGADGILSGGLVFAKTAWKVTLQADSPSMASLEAWDAGQQALGDVAPAQGNITLTGIGRTFQLVTGFLVKGKRLPDAKKTLMPRRWSVDWQQVLAIPVGAAG
jgi:hypothetical protein